MSKKNSDLRDLLEAGPSAPAEVKDCGELVLAEEAAAVPQAAGEVLVVNEDKLHPDPDTRLGGTKGISEPLFINRIPLHLRFFKIKKG